VLFRSFDVGYFVYKSAIFFIGGRVMEADFKFTDTNKFEALSTKHDISSAVFGVGLRTKPDKTGITAKIEMCAVPSGGEGAAEIEINVGYKFKGVPISLNIGYGAWFFKSEDPSSASILKQYGVEDYETDSSHGLTLNIGYTF
jgi:hypothetical protein